MEVDEEILYQIIVEIVSCPEFTRPIKNWIDKNCDSFYGLEENTIEQLELHKQFIKFVEDHLDTSLKNCEITNEKFLLAAKKALNDPKNSKYFDHLISFTNYNFFKGMMTKRNLKLQKMAMQVMVDEEVKNPSKNEEQTRAVLEKIYKQKEEEDIKNAIKISNALKEEQTKLQKMEEEQLKKAIEQSLIDSQAASNQKKMINEFKGLLDNTEEREKEFKLKEEEEENERKENEKKILNFFSKNQESKKGEKINEDILSQIEKDKKKQLADYTENIRQSEINKRTQMEKEEEENLEKEEEKPKEETKEGERMALRKHLAMMLKGRRRPMNI